MNLTWWSKLATRLPFATRTDLQATQGGATRYKGAPLPRLGVFIDFENVNGAAIPLALAHLHPHWNLIWRRAYGSDLAKHKSLFHENGILPIEVVPNTFRKNAADIALVIDVVLAACSNSLDGFCIMSSDSDYTRLALTLRERGKPLVVIGRSNAPQSLRSACSDFIDLDALMGKSPQIPLRDTVLSSLDAAAMASEGLSSEPQAPAGSYVMAREKSTGRNAVEKQVDPYELIPLIGELMRDRGTTNLKAIQARCSHRYKDFSPRMCGAKKWITLLQRLAVFRVDPIRDTTGRIRDYAVGFLSE